jgi:hypothetical protein
MTGSEALETIWNDVPTSPRWSLGTVKTMNGKQWQNIRIQGTCHFDRFCIHFQMVRTSHLRFKCTKMPVDWGLQPYIICPIWLMSNLVDVLLTYLLAYLLTCLLTYLLTYFRRSNETIWLRSEVQTILAHGTQLKGGSSSFQWGEDLASAEPGQKFGGLQNCVSNR